MSDAGLGDVSEMWFQRTQAPVIIERPSCYDRPAFSSAIASAEFSGLQYEFRQSLDCPHWKQGGNAWVRSVCDSMGGRRFSWGACNGCKWKGRSER